MMVTLNPMDIVVMDGTNWHYHKIMHWRCLDLSVHCTTIRESNGQQYDPDFGGLKLTSINDYKGRKMTIHRHRRPLSPEESSAMIKWCDGVMQTNTGYDLRQWVMGFVLGITAKTQCDNETSWTCAELPYWAFQENGFRLTSTDETLPMPRLFRYNPLFTCIFDGVW